MKIITKILNILVILLVTIGIASSVYWIKEWKHRNDINPQNAIIDSLEQTITQKDTILQSLTEKIKNQKEQTNQYKEKWENVKIEQQKTLQNVQKFSTDELIKYITEYFNFDTISIQKKDSLYIIMRPALIDSIGQTIAKYEDNLKLLEAYEIKITTSNNLINSLEVENLLLERQNEQLQSINDDLKTQNEMYKINEQEKDKQIKKLKFQRTMITIGGIVIIILVAL
jgi:phosphopantothenate synthetase